MVAQGLPTLENLKSPNTPDIKCPAGHFSNVQRLHQKLTSLKIMQAVRLAAD